MPSRKPSGAFTLPPAGQAQCKFATLPVELLRQICQELLTSDDFVKNIIPVQTKSYTKTTIDTSPKKKHKIVKQKVQGYGIDTAILATCQKLYDVGGDFWYTDKTVTMELQIDDVDYNFSRLGPYLRLFGHEILFIAPMISSTDRRYLAALSYFDKVCLAIHMAGPISSVDGRALALSTHVVMHMLGGYLQGKQVQLVGGWLLKLPVLHTVPSLTLPDVSSIQELVIVALLALQPVSLQLHVPRNHHYYHLFKRVKDTAKGLGWKARNRSQFLHQQRYARVLRQIWLVAPRKYDEARPLLDALEDRMLLFRDSRDQEEALRQLLQGEPRRSYHAFLKHACYILVYAVLIVLLIMAGFRILTSLT